MLRALSRIIDPDFGMDIVACGFVKDMSISGDGSVAFQLELTTPACPIKDEFERKVTLPQGSDSTFTAQCEMPTLQTPVSGGLRWTYVGCIPICPAC